MVVTVPLGANGFPITLRDACRRSEPTDRLTDHLVQ
jgi:hypothetical protein